MNATDNNDVKTKFCKHCAEKIDVDCVICPKCGKQVEKLESGAAAAQPQIVIQNTNTNTNTNTNANINVAGGGQAKNKWVALALCFFLGFVGAHKFYENKAGMGILYIFTGGLFFIGVIIDFITLLSKPDVYYV